MKITSTPTASPQEDALWYFLSLLVIPFGNVAFGIVFSFIFYLVKFLISRIPTQRYDKRPIILVAFFIHVFFSISSIALFATIFFTGPLDTRQQLQTAFTILTIVLTLIQSVRLLRPTSRKS